MTIFDKLELELDKLIILIKNYMNKIFINGESFNVKGDSIVVKNGKVMVDGDLIKDGLSGTVKIEFKGDLASLDCTNAVVNGNIKGDVDCTSIIVNGDVGGNVDSTTISCGNIMGNIDAMTVKKRN